MQNADKTNIERSDKKTDILEAAALLFAQRGYAAVSMRDLARQTQITPAALYHHFQDKAAIHSAALQYIFADKVTAVSDLVKGDDTSEIKLEKLILWLTLQFAENPIMMRLLQRELLAGDKQRIKALSEDVITAPLQEIQRLMQKLAPDRDARVSAFSIISLIMGFVELSPVREHLTGQRGDRKTLLEFASHAKQMIICGLVTQPLPKETC